MKLLFTIRKAAFALLFLALGLSGGFAQKMPSEFSFSSDGYRLIRGIQESTGFYNTTTIDTMYLTFAQTNYWALLTANYTSKTEIPATLVYKGTTYSNVGVRFRGNTSYQQYVQKGSQKLSFKISLDYSDDSQEIDGYNTIKLNNSADDASFMREFLYSYYCRKHAPCAKVNYVVLMINGSSWGIYPNVQQLDKRFTNDWFLDKDVTRWRAEATSSSTFGGAGGFGLGTSSLNYLSTMDTTTYIPNYTLKSTDKYHPWADLVNACYRISTVKTMPLDTLAKYLDIDGTLWYLANEILFTDEDGYAYKGGMDYYVYYDITTNRLVPGEYDGNSSFVTNYATTWTPFASSAVTTSNQSKYALMYYLFNVPELRQRYLAHVRTIISEAFDLTTTNALIDKYSSLISAYVAADPKNTYKSQFSSEVTALKTFMSNRRTYLLSNTEVKRTGRTISSVVYKTDGVEYANPNSTQSVVINATLSATTGTPTVNLYYGSDFMGNFTKTTMYDDGSHEDGAAGDNVYGGTIPAFTSGSYVRFYVESVATDGYATRTYYPAGAEFDVMIYRVQVAESTTSSVVINELMSSNTNTVADQNGEYDDWIELYNNSSSAVDLTGYYLAGSSSNLTKWKFPDGTTIAGNGYLIIWADKDTTQSGLHANFKLSAKGEELYLVTPELQIADQVVFSAQPDNETYSRNPNGTGDFVWQSPTYLANNVTGRTYTAVSNQQVQSSVLIYPNPAKSVVTLQSTATQSVSIFDVSGVKVYQNTFTGNLNVNVSKFPAGVYTATFNNGVSKKIIVIH